VANRPDPAGEDLRTLLGDIARDARGLLTQQAELFSAELRDELARAGGAAGMIAGGGGLAAAGWLLTGFMLAHLIRSATGLPMWACYGLAAGGLAGAGAGLVLTGTNRLADLKPLPETAAALGENLEWLRDRLSPAAG
jgi:hypothetical protein